MFDLRYHITSLAAIFLALGLGVLIGITMVDDQILVNEQKHLIDRLEEDFYFLREQNSAVRQEAIMYKNSLEVWEEFSQAVLPYAIEGRLDGRRLALVQTGNTPLPEGLLANLEIAGAEIVSFINMGFLNQMDQELPAVSWGEKNQEELNNWAWEVAQVAEQICHPAELQGNVEAVILIGGTDVWNGFLAEQFDIPLIDCLRDAGLLVAGVEESGMEHSYIPYYRKGADIVIDHIETLPGQVALIWALTGIPGYYGIQSDAAALLPNIK